MDWYQARFLMSNSFPGGMYTGKQQGIMKRAVWIDKCV